VDGIMTWSKISTQIFELDASIRYIAVNQGGEIVEMEQRIATFNPVETDKMEELIVNPTVLNITKRRGDLDLEGVNFVLIKYGLQYQAIFNYRDGHVSVGIELVSNAISIVNNILNHLQLPTGSSLSDEI
jgi:hypothetical protein